MVYRRLLDTDLAVSRIGFGCWPIGSHGYGRVNDAESIRAVRAALEAGVTLFDTADVYGFGHSESVLAEALDGRRRDVIVATKFGVAWDPQGRTQKDASPRRMREALEGSLRRLKLDSIPLYQVHWWDEATPIHDTIEALLRVQQEGKIQHIGCTNFPADIVAKASCSVDLAVLQYPYSILHRESEPIITASVSHATRASVIAYNVLARGLLTGKFGAIPPVFPDGDTRASSEDFQGATYQSNLLVVERVRDMAQRYGVTCGQLAIRYALDAPYVSSAIIGHKYDWQVKENLQAFDVKISSEDWSLLHNLVSPAGGDRSEWLAPSDLP